LIDIPKCIGCGNCVRACATENDVPDGHFRTWVERYNVSDEDMTNPHVISPDGARRVPVAEEDGEKYFFVPKMCNHCADSPCTQVCPVGATFIARTAWCWWTRSIALDALIACRPALMAAGTFTAEGSGGQVHTLLSPHHEGSNDGMLRSLSDRGAATGGLEESE